MILIRLSLCDCKLFHQTSDFSCSWFGKIFITCVLFAFYNLSFNEDRLILIFSKKNTNSRIYPKEKYLQDLNQA